MSTWLILPLRSIHDGKLRLASTLDAPRRGELVRRLLAHTITQAAAFAGAERTLLVSPCAEACAYAAERGVRVLREAAADGLNQAVQRGREAARSARADRIVLLSCDLPLLNTDDLQALTAAVAAGTMALAPDRAGTGTNALGLDADVDFEFRFGPDSCALHHREAGRLGLAVREVKRMGLAFDLDVADDLLEWERRSDNRLVC